MDLPVIIQFAPVHEVHNPLALMGPLMVDFAKKAKVPVCVHLDHGDSIDRVKFALSMGFTLSLIHILPAWRRPLTVCL